MQATTFGETLNIISKNECEIEIEDFFQNLRKNISILKDSPVIDEDKIISKSISHSLFKYNVYNGNIESIKNIVFNAAIDCERYIGGSADTFLLILEKTLSLHKEKRKEYIHHSLLESSKYLNTKRRLLKSDIPKIIKDYHPISKDIIKKSLSLCSPRTVLNLEKSEFFQDRIIEKNSLHFDVKPIPGFCEKTWIKEEVKTLMVDGVIEDVASIHHFLTKAYETKEPFLLIARAYKPEVLKTIAENNARGNTDIMVMDLGFSMDNHHFLKDISRIFDIQYASPEFGDVISVFVRRGLESINKVSVSNQGIDFFIKDDKNLNILRAEVSDLAYKNLGDKANDLIQKRLKCLSSDRVVISIGKDSMAKNPVIIEELDIFIRRFKSLMRDGVVFTKIKDIDKIKKVYNSIEISFIFNKLQSVIRSIESINCIITRR
tara:strand:- start:2434 stop:3732 length:1299 start_codon:yes stop_codon:yes gene_type:complete